LQFLIKGKVHYGWARLTVVNNHPGLAATLTGFAYETVPCKPIITGQTKESGEIVQPARLGHLARGASAISAWRVKQTASTTH